MAFGPALASFFATRGASCVVSFVPHVGPSEVDVKVASLSRPLVGSAERAEGVFLTTRGVWLAMPELAADDIFFGAEPLPAGLGCGLAGISVLEDREAVHATQRAAEGGADE